MKKKQRFVFILFGVAILVILVIIFSNSRKRGAKKNEKRKTEKSIKKVPVWEVKNEKKAMKIVSFGRLKSLNKITISGEVQGILKRASIPLREGVNFRKGVKLFYIDNNQDKLSLKSKKSNFITKIANLIADIQIDFKSEIGKWKDFLSKFSVDNPLPPLPKSSSDKEKIFLASKNILTDYYSIESDENRFQKNSYVAAFEGSINKLLVEEGTPVNVGSNIIEIVNTQELELVLNVQEKKIPYVRVGQKVKVIHQNNHNKYEYYKVDRIGDVIDPNTQTIQLYVNVYPKKGFKVLDGMYLEAVIEGVEEDGVFEIPRRALLESDEIYIVNNKDSTLFVQKVNLLIINQDYVMVKGLKDKQQIVAAPLINAYEGLKVYPVMVQSEKFDK